MAGNALDELYEKSKEKTESIRESERKRAKRYNQTTKGKETRRKYWATYERKQ